MARSKAGNTKSGADHALADLIRLCKPLGRELSVSAKRHASVSVKATSGDHMIITEAERDLLEVAGEVGWVCVGLFSAGASATAPREGDVAAPADWPAHASLGRCVAQICPPAVAAYVCSKGGEAAISKIFSGEKDPPVWVRYADPGEGLARRIEQVIARHEAAHGRKPKAFLIDRRGLLVSADTPGRVLSSVRRLVSACEARLSTPGKMSISPSASAVAEAKLAIRGAVFRSRGEHILIEHSASPAVAWYLRRRDAKELTHAGAVNEIELMHTGGGPIWLDRADGKSIEAKLRRAEERGETPARCFLVKGLGLFIAGKGTDLGAARDAAEASLLTRGRAADLGGVKSLTRRQCSVLAAAQSQRSVTIPAELAGRVAVVTGAGSGLGRSIAAGLAEAGAAVALVDLDLPSARKSHQLIRQRVPDAVASAIRCDVTDERGVARAYDAVLDLWGGLDILVNAAGIAPSYPLVDLSPDKWRATLEVNLTGYFFMAQAAARIMMRQGMGGSIINLSSKSGLEASKDNTAYNATKAAEIHMARGWALELGDHAIRVNSVAPGNVFEGSKIWNPEYIRSCAKKYGIKPEEVIPYYIDKTALKRDIKGSDVADAVVFLCSDRARTITGQILVVDSGQVMVR